MSDENWAAAAGYLEKAEEAYPQIIALLETCYRELGDFKLAYEYACRLRNVT